jgi:predicted ATP-grasp superfamily ATP-dependent carboligase
MFPDLDVTDPQVVAEVNRLMSDLPLNVGDSTSNIAGLLGYDGVELVMGRESYVIYFNRGIFQILDAASH